MNQESAAQKKSECKSETQIPQGWEEPQRLFCWKVSFPLSDGAEAPCPAARCREWRWDGRPDSLLWGTAMRVRNHPPSPLHQ